MKTLNTYINEWKLNDNSKNKVDTSKINVATYKELSNIVYDRYQENNKYLDLRDINVSNIKSFDESQPFGLHLNGLFADFENVEIIDITGWNTRDAKSFSCMFWGCENLKEIKGIENLNVSNADHFNGMFSKCENLRCNLNNWEVRKDANVDRMFSECDTDKIIIPDWYIKMTTK